MLLLYSLLKGGGSEAIDSNPIVMGAEVTTCKLLCKPDLGEASKKVLRAITLTLFAEVRMRTAITVAIVLVWAAPAIAAGHSRDKIWLRKGRDQAALTPS